MDFEKMRAIRKAQHKSQDDLAEYLGVNRATVSKYETGIIEPSLSQISRIAEFLNVSQAEILGLESFSSPAEFEKRWTELTGTPHNIDPAQSVPIAGHKFWLMDAFDKLNNEGQRKAVERVEELTEIPKYQKTPPQD